MRFRKEKQSCQQPKKCGASFNKTMQCEKRKAAAAKKHQRKSEKKAGFAWAQEDLRLTHTRKQKGSSFVVLLFALESF